ncbi:MAG: methyltransferase domain-containing protein [Candidatus Heimdallarchaeota archaeon]|nr:methyltransferase domain-containing protein [Candidatus Heimdallarchaeota archaeon]
MDLFSRIASKYDHIIKGFDLETIIHDFPIYENDLMLDLGGGTGRVAIPFLKYVNECLILDRSFEMLKQAQAKSRDLLLVQGTSDFMPFRENTIMQIFVNDVLHHIHRQTETLRESYHILKNQGTMTIRDYDRKYLGNIFLLIFEKLLRFGSKFFSPQELKDQCMEFGFTVNWKRLTKGTYLLSAEKNLRSS